ncbi:universal stress protein [Chitinophagaceae bacterium MMS25-I14]
MKKVLIVTDFSTAARHAADYTCQLIKDKGVTAELLHIYPVPVTYTAEGIALASISEAIQRVEEQMKDELQHIKLMHPGTAISGRVVTGNFLETLRNEAVTSNPEFIVLGTAGFTDLYVGDEDPLNALKAIPVPVLFIPANAMFRPVRQIAYPCNYAHIGARTPLAGIKKWISFVGAELHILHVDKHSAAPDEKQQQGLQWLQVQLQEYTPDYNWIEDPELLHGVSVFIKEKNIDMLVVVPHQYGVWEGMFHQSRTKALARFNDIPVMAIHEQ